MSVRGEATVLEAMEKMCKANYSNIAIVDSSNVLLGNISMADIRFIFQHGRYNRLWMTCFSFMSAALSQKSLEADGKDRFPFFDVRRSSTLEHTMEKTIATHCHRLWIVDEAQCLIGAISLTDIIECFIQQFPPNI